MGAERSGVEGHSQLYSKFEARLESNLDYKSKKQLRSEDDGMCSVEADDEKLQCALSKQGHWAAALIWAARASVLSSLRLLQESSLSAGDL